LRTGSFLSLFKTDRPRIFRVGGHKKLTGVEDALALRIIEWCIAEVGVVVWPDEPALRKDGAEHDDVDNWGRKVHGSAWWEDYAAIDDAEHDAARQENLAAIGVYAWCREQKA
jgi:hypothetical protein